MADELARQEGLRSWTPRDDEHPEDFPTGRPVSCPSCGDWISFLYVTERSGNIRRYRCRKCGDMYLATWKGAKITSCLSEPQSTRMEDWSWARVVESPALPAPKKELSG